MINFTESLHLELAGSEVCVQVLCPGFTRTNFQSTAGMDISGLPNALWMNADDVVEESLRALERGKVVVIPGKRNVLFYLGYKLLPRPLLYRILDNMLTHSKLAKK